MPNNTLSFANIIATSITNPSSTFYISTYTDPYLDPVERTPLPTWVNPYRFTPIDRSDEHKYRQNRCYDPYNEWQVLMSIKDAIRAGGEVAQYGYVKRFLGEQRYGHFFRDLDQAKQHLWHWQLQRKFGLHPAIKDAVDLAPPADRQQLIFEWPHVSETDPSRLAYTRDERSGQEDRQVVTTIGKYLHRHFPQLTDNQIRDIAMRRGVFNIEVWDTTAKIVKSVQEGPASCMQWDDDPDEWDRTDGKHPYEAYAPEYGWRAVVRLDGKGDIVGRCLVNEEKKIFVRSYARKEDGYSHSDEAIEVWLRDHGFTKAGNWEGCKLKRIGIKNRWGEAGFIAPYLDGHPKGVADCGDYLMVREGGEYWLENTDGTATRQDLASCECCGNDFEEDDLSWVGADDDSRVCQGCIEYSYTYVYGRRGNQYYQHEDRVVYCEHDGEYYDSYYLSDNNIIELHNGDLCPSDQAVYLESRDEYVHQEDEDAIYCEQDGTYEHTDDTVCLEDGTYAHEDNAWHCTISGDYYHNDYDAHKVELCDIETQMHHTAHEDAVAEYFHADLDDIADAIADMTV